MLGRYRLTDQSAECTCRSAASRAGRRETWRVVVLEDYWDRVGESDGVCDGTTVSSEGREGRKVMVHEQMAGLSRGDVRDAPRCHGPPGPPLSTTMQLSTPLDTLLPRLMVVGSGRARAARL